MTGLSGKTDAKLGTGTGNVCTRPIDPVKVGINLMATIKLQWDIRGYFKI